MRCRSAGKPQSNRRVDAFISRTSSPDPRKWPLLALNPLDLILSQNYGYIYMTVLKLQAMAAYSSGWRR